MWIQKEFSLKSRQRGFHLVTEEVLKQLPEIRQFKVGLLHLLLQHTSASLTINENADPDVRHDMEEYISRTVPENAHYYQHLLEGSDDMPAHIKSSLFGVSLQLPITSGDINLGTWQGIYLGEHRNRGGARTVVATINGEQF